MWKTITSENKVSKPSVAKRWEMTFFSKFKIWFPEFKI